MKILKNLALSAAAAVLAVACGGGGGSPGETHTGYQITLRAERTQLPVNLGNVGPGIGVSSPYTTTIYVNATEGGNPIPGGEDIFGCNTAYGLSSGPLYYLDGKDEHEHDVTLPDGTTVKVPSAYRSITLGSNAGGNSFHFHAQDTAGKATITCSVTDPRDKRNVSASIDITVGAATGKAASIETIVTTPALGTQGNPNNVPGSTAVNVHVRDDANQPIPDGAQPNLQVAIVAGGASAGARLFTATQDGSVVQVRTNNGVGLFSLASGAAEGTILLELTADRADNDVSNGIQNPVVQLLAVSVTAGTPTGTAPVPVVIGEATPADATNGLPYSYAFSATGGTAPYTWIALGGLPDGLSLSASGVLSGTPTATNLIGTYVIAVRVTDSKGSTATANFSMKVEETPDGDPLSDVLAITAAGCGSDFCKFAVANPAATAPTDDLYYKYALTVAGTGTGSAVWVSAPTPPRTWVSLSVDGTLAVSWAATQAPAPQVKDCTSPPFTVTAARGGKTATRTVVMVVGSGAGTCKP
ncbi:MAG: Ig domain-containing protein [Comamonas sp.]|nr:Ig domain-containing protein [Comamonas sp.]